MHRQEAYAIAAPLPDGRRRQDDPLSPSGRAKHGTPGSIPPARKHQGEGKRYVASEATGVSGLAGRYATALFDLADEQKALDQVAADFATLSAMIHESADLVRLLRSPLVGREQQGAVMAALGEKAELSLLTRNFIGLVARNRRLFVLTAIIDAYRKLLADRRGEIRAEVTAAQALSTAQVEAVTDQLKRTVGSKVAVDIRVDPAILGGLIIKVGSRMVDGSLSSKLTRLQLAMRGN